MSAPMHNPMSQPYGYRGDWRSNYNYPAPPLRQSGGLPLLPLLGLGALGLIALGGFYFGPDVVRYLKIRSM